MKPKTTIRLDMTSLHTPSFHSPDFQSTSPYPPSSPSTDSSDAEDLPRVSKTSIRSSIAELPETKLRSILFKLASSNPRFERAIKKELALVQTSGDSPPMTPTCLKPRKMHRNKKRHSCKEVQVVTQEEPMVQNPGTVSPSLSIIRLQEEFLYHPGKHRNLFDPERAPLICREGHLNREVYEFLPHAPQRDAAFTDMRMVTMWSCCDEDEWSPGCTVLSPFMDPLIQNHYGQNAREPPHPDCVFPDSELEHP